MLTRKKGVIALVVTALVAAVVLVTTGSSVTGGDRWKVAAEFTDTTGLYVGNEVQYLGVPVGEITAIEPQGPVMRVEMEVDDDIEVPREAVAEILQSSLLTDRYVELGPVYSGGPTLPADATIPASRTRAPISFDQLGEAIDNLVVALDREGPDGRDIGDLLDVTAKGLDGNGARIRRLLVASRDALASINTKAPDLQVITKNLRVLTRVLGSRDAMVRRFTTNLADASAVVRGQTGSLDKTLRSLSALSTEVATFLDENRSVLKDDLADVAKVTRTIHDSQQELARIFDYLPTGAENIARAYDPDARSIRVQLAIRDGAFFNALVRQGMCQALAGSLCQYLTNPEGTGLVDLLLDGLESQLPGGF